MDIKVGTKWITKPVEPTEVEITKNEDGIIVTKCLATGEVYSVSGINSFEQTFEPCQGGAK